MLSVTGTCPTKSQFMWVLVAKLEALEHLLNFPEDVAPAYDPKV